MKQFFKIAVILSSAAALLSSCVADNQEKVEESGLSREVNFNAALAGTRTGLAFKFVPNWINTSTSNVHLFEAHGDALVEGSDVKMSVEGDNSEIAHFSAEFSEEWTIDVPITKASDSYTYTAIISRKDEAGKFIVPSTQYPDSESLIDPSADFLIATAVSEFDESQAGKAVDLDFVRPVSVSRMSFMFHNMDVEGEVVKKVTINSSDNIAGAAAYSGIDFTNGTVNFAEGSSSIVVSYGDDGVAMPDEATFYAYFVSLPGNKVITSVVVETDKYIYTKTMPGTGKSITFTASSFKNISVDLSGASREAVTPLPEQEVKLIKGDTDIAGTEETFDLINGADKYVAPVITGAAAGADVEVSVVCDPSDVVVAEAAWTAEAGLTVTPKAVGKAVITVTAKAEGYKKGTATYTLVVVDTTPAPVTTKKFYKASGIADGEQYVVVADDVAMAINGSDLTAEAVEITDGVFEIDPAKVVLWTAAEHVEYYSGTSAAGHYTLAYDGKFLQRKSASSTQTAVIDEIPSTAKYYVWEYDGEHVYHLSSASNTFYLTYSSETWKFTYNSTPNAYLYTQKAPQSISFSAESAEYDLYTRTWTVAVPTLSDAVGTVSYASSDEAVATVDPSSGVVTPVAKGTAVITATAAGDETHQAASAFFTVTVTDSTPVAETVIEVEKATELTEGQQYFLVSNGYALVRNGETAEAAEFSAEEGKITVPSDLKDNLQWTLESGYAFKNGGYYFGVQMDQSSAPYSYSVAMATSRTVATKVTLPDLTIALETGYIYYKGNSSSQYIYYNASDKAWTNGKESNGTFNEAYATFLYVVKDTREAQELSFVDGDDKAVTELAFDLGGSDTFAAPTLKGAKTGVTYSSSNTAVATVDEASGAVTFVNAGTVVITATAAASETYKSASASYTIVVSNSALTASVYQKVTSSDEIVSGGSYLIVYENGTSSKVFKPILSEDKKTFTASSTANAVNVTIDDSKITSSVFDDFRIKLDNQDGTNLKFAIYVPSVEKYFILRNSSGSYQASDSGSGYRTTFSISDGVVSMSCQSYYNGYSTSSKYFRASTSDSKNLSLYKLVE